MVRLIKQINGHSAVHFDSGSFDDWCVYLRRANGVRYAPKDTEYFSALQQLGRQHGVRKLYRDFLQVYALTGPTVDEPVLRLIESVAAGYGRDAEEVETWLTVIYGGMVAEENKQHAILKKRIKRLGIHQVLIEGLSPQLAASFSKGKKWRALDQLMREKGF